MDLYGICDEEEIPYCIFFKNGYEDNHNKYLPLIICDSPYVPYRAKIKISTLHFSQLCLFVVKHKDDLIDLTSGNKYLSDDFWIDNFLTERKMSSEETKRILLEMSRIRKGITGLPMDIWLDNGKTYEKSGHDKRIKFKQENNPSNITKSWCSLTIPNLKIVSSDRKTIRPKNIELLKKFYILNKSMIDDAMEEKINMDFVKAYLKPIDSKGNEVKMKKPYTYYKSAGFGIELVTDNETGLFAYMKDDKFLFDNKWFFDAHSFQEVDGEIIAWVRDTENSIYYTLNINEN